MTALNRSGYQNFSMPRLQLLLSVLYAACLHCSAPEAADSSAPAEIHHFAYERYSAAAGSLYRSGGGNLEYDDSVKSVHVDPKGRVWVGTVTGLAVYDNNRWQTRTFATKQPSKSARRVLGFFGIEEFGPHFIAHGTGGQVWLCGAFGVWQYVDSEYTPIDETVTSRMGIAVDGKDNVYVVEKYRVRRYDGRIWSTVLDPFEPEPSSSKPDGLNGIQVDGEGVVWIGATRHGRQAGQFRHNGPIWIANSKLESQGLAPPKAAVFAFDGSGWRAFGQRDGLDVKWCQPRLDRDQRIRLNSPDGVFQQKGQSWVLSGQQQEAYSGKNWALRETDRGRAQLIYREGGKETVVRPLDPGTGEVLDLSAEQLVLLSLAEDKTTGRAWLGTWHGLYLIWRDGTRALLP